MKSVLSIIIVLFLVLAPFGLTTASAAQPAYSGHPYIEILAVDKNDAVTIRAYNLPKYDTFAVLENYMGTRGKSGVQVGTLKSGANSEVTQTYSIAEAFRGQKRIAIRIQSTTGSGYFAYNWFYNKNSGAQPPSVPSTPSDGYTGFPTFSIKSVVRNVSVTIVTNNLPPNDTFAVKMNYMGTRGKNGWTVATLNSGAGGKQTLTYSIPAELHGQRRIAIRLQSTSGSGYFAYNWFYNNTYP
ncbi:MAG: hypothetical protein ACWGO1_07345 [Anaerolineales bacterium]